MRGNYFLPIRQAAGRLLLVGCSAVAVASDVHARKLTPMESQALSPLCRAVLIPDRPRNERMLPFRDLLSGACGVHHTCYGEVAMIRYRQAGLDPSLYSSRGRQSLLERKKKIYLGTAISEYGYEIRCAPPSYPLLPMIHTQRGNALSLLGKHSEAIRDFARALELKPDYAPAQQGLAAAQARAALPKAGR